MVLLRIISSAIALVAVAATASAQAATTATNRVVVVTDGDKVNKDDYSIYWNQLQSQGFQLEFTTPATNQDRPLQLYGEPTFEHLIILAPQSKAFPPELSPQSILSYIDKGKNVLIALDHNLSEFWRDFAREFDIDFDDRGSQLIDHFHYDQAQDEQLDNSHSTIIVSSKHSPAPFVSTASPPILYRGVGHQAGRLPLLTNVLHANPTSYSFETNPDQPPTEDPFLLGSTIGLVSSVQARNNARVTFAGSLDLFSDRFAEASVTDVDGTQYPKSGNAPFLKDITNWTFQRSGVLKVESTKLSRAKDGQSLPLYRVRDELDYAIEISQLSPSGSWEPFVASDLQFEFTMLDPHLRLPLPHSPQSSSSSSSKFSTRFTAPDRHGVFTLRVDYRRPGWTYVDEKTVVSVTPPRHDEYDRFIFGAYPWYAGAFSVSIATLVVVVAWSLQ
ncbi:Dolichyl-diphosphooligosaccharide-protein glycosyltransferase 48kDa subunit [Meredithblackwellia eburnea MCA 4105]